MRFMFRVQVVAVHMFSERIQAFGCRSFVFSARAYLQSASSLRSESLPAVQVEIAT